jgi:hypothetical protein
LRRSLFPKEIEHELDKRARKTSTTHKMSRSVLPQATEIEAVRAYVPASESIGRLGAFEAKVEAEAEAQAEEMAVAATSGL